MAAAQTFSEYQRQLTQQLSTAGIANAALDARLLLQWGADLSQTELALRADEPVADAIVLAMRSLVTQRMGGKPLAKIIGRKEFWGRDFHVSEAVLDPRPDSETLIEAALAKLSPNCEQRLLDLGTGSGCLVLTLLAERPMARAVGIDKSRPALSMARRNAYRLGVRDRAALRHGDWFEGLTDDGGFDMIISNPPYIETAELAGLAAEVLHDPLTALDGGPDGLAPYRIITPQALRFLKPGGFLVFEIGATQGAQVSAMLGDAGFMAVETKTDLAGRDRVIIGQKS